jgi:rod shape-determining protein MreD
MFRNRSLHLLGTGASALLALWATWLQIPGLSLAGVTVDWPLIWVVCWSFERTVWEGCAAGLIIGLFLDGLGSPLPTHCLGLILAGALTARLRGYRLLQSDTLAIALIALGMAVLNETTLALQFSFLGLVPTDVLWDHHQKVSLASGLVTSLWTPPVWWILGQWWTWGRELAD